MPLSTEILLRVKNAENIPLNIEEFRKHSRVTFSQGELLIRNNGRLWTLGCLSELLPKDICENTLDNTHLIARVSDFVETRSFATIEEQILPSRRFLMSMRGAILHGLYFPCHTKFQHSDSVWIRKLLRIAPALQFGPFRFDFSRVQRDSFTIIPKTAIPNIADRNVNVALQELCYLASLSKVVNCNLALQNRFERISSVVAFLYASADLFASRKDSILDWIDARVSEILQNYGEESEEREPLVILFQGKAGAGKTTKVQQICEYLGIPNSEVFCRQETKHWDGYRGQLITLFDDLFQGAHTNRLSEFVNVVNSRAMPLPMANLAQKTVCFTSPIVVITANELTLPPTVNAGAVARRITHSYVVRNGNMYNARLSIEKNNLRIDSRGAPVSMNSLLSKISEYCYGESLPVLSRKFIPALEVEALMELGACVDEVTQTLTQPSSESIHNLSPALVQMLDERVRDYPTSEMMFGFSATPIAEDFSLIEKWIGEEEEEDFAYSWPSLDMKPTSMRELQLQVKLFLEEFLAAGGSMVEIGDDAVLRYPESSDRKFRLSRAFGFPEQKQGLVLLRQFLDTPVAQVYKDENSRYARKRRYVNKVVGRLRDLFKRFDLAFNTMSAYWYIWNIVELSGSPHERYALKYDATIRNWNVTQKEVSEGLFPFSMERRLRTHVLSQGTQKDISRILKDIVFRV